MRPPLASEAVSESTPKPAGGRLRFLNGCVPLSHQVAGHMYGKDKVGKWGWRGACCSLSVFASPRPAEAAWSPGTGLDAPLGLRATSPGPCCSPVEPLDPCSRVSGSDAISRVWGVNLAAGGGGERSAWSPPQGGWVLIGDSLFVKIRNFIFYWTGK